MYEKFRAVPKGYGLGTIMGKPYSMKTTGTKLNTEEIIEVHSEETTGRNLGAMITMLTEAVKALNEKIEGKAVITGTDNSEAVAELQEENTMLKEELCARDNSYSWCEKETQQDGTGTGDGNADDGTGDGSGTGDGTGDGNAGSGTGDSNSGTGDFNTGNNDGNTPSDQNITIEPCEVACENDKDCSDENTYTIDVCNKDGNCESYCINLPVVQG